MKTHATRIGLVVLALRALACSAMDESDPQAPETDQALVAPGATDQPAPEAAPGPLADNAEDPTAPPPDPNADEAAAAEATAVSEIGTGTQVVYVNFTGPTITNCGNYCSDAVHNRSWVVNEFWHRSSIDFAAYNGNRSAIVSALRYYYRNYRVTFTTTRPTSGAYTMVVISPTWGPHHGVAPLDCHNTNHSDVAYVINIGNTSTDTIARYAAHELGHSFGLGHVVASGDIMQWASSGRSFTRSTYDSSHPSGKCFSGSVQDGPALLANALGRR